ncbi:prolipoprotein diacylglyceryl transferase [bacterium]|nr:prolipoprotein diacylglyceryl transferase [bacterium]
MNPILVPIGEVTLKPLILWILGAGALLFFSFAQSYGQAKGWKTGRIIGLGVIFILVGDLIVYLVAKALNCPEQLFVGTVNVYSYGFMLTIAFIVGTIITVYAAKREQVDSEIILDLIFVIIIGALIGARIMYVILKLDEFLTYETIMVGDQEQLKFLLMPTLKHMAAIHQGGLSVHGGVIGATLLSAIYTRMKKLNFWKIADLFAPSLALGMAIGRIGCFLNGCCYGVVCKNPDAWYAVSFPLNTHTGVTPEPRHAAQLYMMALNLIIFFILRGMYKNRKFDGHVFLMWIALYSIARFFQEFFRFGVSSDVIFGTITIAQLASVILAVVAFVIIAEVNKRIEIAKRAKEASE